MSMYGLLSGRGCVLYGLLCGRGCVAKGLPCDRGCIQHLYRHCTVYTCCYYIETHCVLGITHIENSKSCTVYKPSNTYRA